MSPELGKRGNETVILMEVRWVKRAGQEWRSRERTYQGLTPLQDLLQLLMPGEPPGCWAYWYVTLGKSLYTSGPWFHSFRNSTVGKSDLAGPSKNTCFVSFEKQPTPCGVSFTPGLCSSRAQRKGLSSSLFFLNPGSAQPVSFFYLLVIIEPALHYFWLCGKP